jgi:hypothetical protein
LHESVVSSSFPFALALLLLGDPAGIRLRQGYGVTGASSAVRPLSGSFLEPGNAAEKLRLSPTLEL